MIESTEPLKFDPENVERLKYVRYVKGAGFGGSTARIEAEVVRASDYDKLLSLYREAISTCETVQQPRP